MPVVVKRKTEISRADVFGFNPEWLEHWKEWVVIHDYVPFDTFDTEEEAQKIAKLLRKALAVIEDIEAYAEFKLNDLTEEERKFLRDYTSGTITIKV